MDFIVSILNPLSTSKSPYRPLEQVCPNPNGVVLMTHLAVAHRVYKQKATVSSSSSAHLTVKACQSFMSESNTRTSKNGMELPCSASDHILSAGTPYSRTRSHVIVHDRLYVCFTMLAIWRNQRYVATILDVVVRECRVIAQDKLVALQNPHDEVVAYFFFRRESASL